MTILDGRRVAEVWRANLAVRVENLHEQSVTPGLGVILVGQDPSSLVYVETKERTARALGFYWRKITLPTEATANQIVAEVERLNRSTAIHGLIVQLPLPAAIDPDPILEAIAISKDVDGLHPKSLGDLLIGHEAVIPATPKGIIRLLEAYKLPTEGKHVVIVGRSSILGKPLAAIFLNRDATVTICHSKTRDLAKLTVQADIVVMDTGVPGLLVGEMVKPGAIVIDAGITKTAKGAIVGDVDFASVAPRTAAITPVPGGVGPMTIAALLDNTLERAEKSVRIGI